jgi:2'-5' RNA ligase
MRLFAALTPSPEALDHLAGALALLGVSDRGRSPWLPQNNWHLTVAFYGEVPDGQVPSLQTALTEAARDLAPVTGELAGAGQFRGNTAWIGARVDETAWHRLTAALAPANLGLTSYDDPAPRNRPHLTVSRAGANPGIAGAVKALAIYRGPSWTAHDVTLFSSDLGHGVGGHPLYTPLTTATLGRDETGAPLR